MIKSVTQVYILVARTGCFLVFMALPLFANASIQIAIDQLLAKADLDLVADRLMQPISNNAIDRYRAVLLLDKANLRAALGLRKIVERYLVLAESQKTKGEYNKARSFVASGESVNGKTVKLTAMKNSINKAQRANRLVVNRSESVPVAKKISPQQTVFNLNPADLSARNTNIRSQLVALAKRVQESKEYVLIYARNDAEGRWVYQQMRKASANYRLRGNIKRNTKPRVVLDAPLD